MKFTRFATFALVSTIIFGGSVQAFSAESRNVTTDNDVTFTSEGEQEIIVQPPITEPEVGPIDPVPPGQTGPLTLAYVPTTISFGSQRISTQNQAYSMIAEEQPLLDGTGMTPYVSFAQVQDTRGSHEGWNLAISLSDFVSEKSGNALAGARIEFVDPSIVYNNGEGDQALKPSANTNQAGSLFLNVGADNLLVMNAENGHGAGTSSVVWGEQKTIEDTKLNDHIRLHVPGSTAQEAAIYKAMMNWELASTPASAGETIP